MSEEALKIVSDIMESLGIAYEFMEWTGKPEYPYFTGEYVETPPMNEDGMQEGTLILTGHAENSWLALESAKKVIKEHFNKVTGKVVTTDSGSVVAIFYANSMPVKSVDKKLKRIQINLTIKEWSVT